MITRDEFLTAIKLIEDYKKQLAEDIRLAEEAMINDETLIEDTKLSVRAFNALKGAKVNVVGDLKNIKLSDLRMKRGFGEQTWKEVLNLCEKAGIQLK